MVVFMLGLIILNVTNAETAKKKPAKTAKDNLFIWKTKRKDFEPAKKSGGGGSKNTSYMIFSDKRSRISKEISS